jgi:hypothetical protein
MNQPNDHPVENVAASDDDKQALPTTRPKLPQTSRADRAAAALFSALICIALLGSVVLSLTAQGRPFGAGGLLAHLLASLGQS